MNSSKYFSERWSKLITIDKIRLLKYLEIFQYTFIFTILTIIVSLIWDTVNRYLNKDNPNKDNPNKDNPNKDNPNKDNPNNPNNSKKIDIISLFKTTLILIIQTFLIILLVFYIRKIGLLVPSIASLIEPKFRPHTTVEYSINIAVYIIIIELIPEYKHLVEDILTFLKTNK